MITADFDTITVDTLLAQASGSVTPNTCPLTGTMVEAEINRVATEYRESTRLLGLIRTYLRQVEEVAQAICAIPSYFDIETAVGDQLTLLGKRMGWPRCHCVCVSIPVYGFECEDETVLGFCDDGTWINCGDAGNGELCLYNDEVYRTFLKARRYQMLGLYDIESLQTAMRHIWGPTAVVIDTRPGRVTLAPGRELTMQERLELPLVIRVMPIAPGIRVMVSLEAGRFAGFGEGWGGFCEQDEQLTNDFGEPLTNDVGEPLFVRVGANWFCPIDPHAYDCA